MGCVEVRFEGRGVLRGRGEKKAHLTLRRERLTGTTRARGSPQGAQRAPPQPALQSRPPYFSRRQGRAESVCVSEEGCGFGLCVFALCLFVAMRPPSRLLACTQLGPHRLPKSHSFPLKSLRRSCVLLKENSGLQQAEPTKRDACRQQRFQRMRRAAEEQEANANPTIRFFPISPSSSSTRCLSKGAEGEGDSDWAVV